MPFHTFPQNALVGSVLDTAVGSDEIPVWKVVGYYGFQLLSIFEERFSDPTIANRIPVWEVVEEYGFQRLLILAQRPLDPTTANRIPARDCGKMWVPRMTHFRTNVVGSHNCQQNPSGGVVGKYGFQRLLILEQRPLLDLTTANRIPAGALWENMVFNDDSF
jgi:hypothetical protein